MTDKSVIGAYYSSDVRHNNAQFEFCNYLKITVGYFVDSRPMM